MIEFFISPFGIVFPMIVVVVVVVIIKEYTNYRWSKRDHLQRRMTTG
jgi:hypothetical protein